MVHRIYDKYKQIILYTLIAALIGVIVGAIDALFGVTLLSITDIRDNNIIKIVPFLPIAGVVIMLLYKQFSKESMKGMTLVFQTGLGDNDRIPKSLIPLVMICTWITHLFGGSAGREGVAVQLGATVAHTIGRKMKMPNNSRVLLIAGMAAGFSGLFQTPLAATFFAMEVLVAGSLQYEALLPALMASFVASYTSIESPWFKESAKQEKNKYSNWYIWTDNTWLNPPKEYANSFVKGFGTRNGQYMLNFYYCEPALNYGFALPDTTQKWQLPLHHPDVMALRGEMKNVLKFWMDLGADGFRADMAGALVKTAPPGDHGFAGCFTGRF